MTPLSQTKDPTQVNHETISTRLQEATIIEPKARVTTKREPHRVSTWLYERPKVTARPQRSRLCSNQETKAIQLKQGSWAATKAQKKTHNWAPWLGYTHEPWVYDSWFEPKPTRTTRIPNHFKKTSFQSKPISVNPILIWNSFGSKHVVTNGHVFFFIKNASKTRLTFELQLKTVITFPKTTNGGEFGDDSWD